MDSGILIGGFNPLYVDSVATTVMGFSPAKIKMYSEGVKQSWLNVKKISLKNIHIKAGRIKFFTFKEPVGWKGHL